MLSTVVYDRVLRYGGAGILSGSVDPLGAFLTSLNEVSPGNLRAVWLPIATDTTETVTEGRTWTYDADISGSITVQGNGVYITFNGTSNNADTPATANVSFGNGTVDSPFSGCVLASLTNQATQRGMLGKYSTAAAGNREYVFNVDSGEKFAMFLYDASANAQPIRRADAVVATGALKLFGWSYSAATGGATAANDITMYLNGALVASTAINDASYVAMEVKAAALNVGGGQSTGAGADEFFAGPMAFAALYAANLSVIQHASIKTAVDIYYGLDL